MWNAIKAAVQAGIEFISKVPVSGLIKAGIFVGITAFTFWVMYRRTKTMHNESKNEAAQRRSPVDEILEMGYSTNPDSFDDMDPEARKICRQLNKGWRKKKKKKNQSKTKVTEKEPKVRTVSLFDSDLDELDDEEVEEDNDKPRFFRSADDMNRYYYSKKKVSQAKANAKRNVKAKGGKIIDKDHMEQLRQLCYEWRESGCADTGTFKSRLDAIAKELGLAINEVEDAVDDTLREECPNLF